MSFQDIESGGRYGNNNNGGFGGWGGGGGGNNPRGSAGGYGADDDFDELNNRISKTIQQVTYDVAQLEKILLVLGTAQDTLSTRENLHSLVGSTRNLVHQVQQDLKDIVALEDKGSETERTRRKRITQRLAKDFQSWLSKFHNVAKKSAEMERSLPPPKQQAPVKNPANAGFNPFLQQQQEEEERTALLAAERRTQFMQVESERDFNEAIIEEREQGIKEIETTMREVNEIFKDLSTIVYEQGQMIENIESYVGSAVVNTTIGVEELKGANENLGGATKCSYFIIGIVAAIVIAVIVIVVLAIYFKTRGDGSDSSA